MIKSAKRKNTRQFRKSQTGMAATEFALIAPLLIVIFLGIIEVSDAYLAGRKVDDAINTVADLVSQEETLSFNDVGGVFSAFEQIVGPYGINGASYYIVSVMKDNNDKVRVEWSLDENKNVKFAKGSEYTDLATELNLTGPNSILPQGSSVIISKVTYPFQSSLASKNIGTLSFSRYALRWPRRSYGVVYCNQSNQCSDN